MRKSAESAKVATLPSRKQGVGRSVLCRNMTLFAFVLTHELQIQHQNRSFAGHFHWNRNRADLVVAA
jgi:hypothetical protein